MATKVEESQYEVEADLNIVAPKLRGLYDLSVLKVSADPADMTPQAHESVMNSIKDYERRQMLEKNHHDASVALLADGYPNLPLVKIDPVALTSIQSNAASVVLAASIFTTNVAPPADQAKTLDLSEGPTEKK